MADGFVRSGLLRPDWSKEINVGLAGWWTFLEGCGAKAWDISGKNNHGTLTNGPTWQDGGFRFDGTNDYVDCGTMGSWGSNRLNGFSVSTLINPATANLQTYFGQIEAASGQNGLSLRVNTNSSNTVSAGSVRVGMADNATVTLSAATNVDNVPRNAWTRLTITAKPTVGNIEIYVNGVRQSLTYGAANNLTTFVNLTYGNFIGAFNNIGTADGFFQGRIRDFRAWTRVLSALEAQQLALNPNIGLWVPDTIRYYIPAAGGGFQPAWAANSNVLLGGGMAL